MMLLEGVRVIDWGLGQVGPYAAMLLGDLGAEVIKIEPPDTGDFMRRLDNFLGCSLWLAEDHNAAFEAFNRNKRSVAVDLSTAEGRDVVKDLVKESDVFVTNYRAQAAVKLGFDYDSLKQLNPGLIYASSSCFGPEGPDAGKRGDDPTAQGRIGMMFSCSEPSERPHYVSPGSGDAIAAMMLASAVQGALYAREKHGIGQEVTVSQVSTLMALLRFQVTMAFLGGYKNAEMKMPHDDPVTAHSGWFRSKDGKWVFISAAWTGEAGWREICQRIGQPQLLEDPRFVTIRDRLENSAALKPIIEDTIATRTSAEWETAFAGFEGNFSRLRDDLLEMADDPQMLANNYVVEDEHPVLGRIKTLGILPDFSETPGELRTPPPELGQHTEEVLLDVLGYDWERIGELKELHAII
jgi:crotonobetainyl-CoA:carnitine CoA-transferase CaiB-like acyl-CoA transferase